VDVMPSMGAIVGWAGGGSDVSVGRVVDMGGRVAVLTDGTLVAVTLFCTATLQLTSMKLRMNRIAFLIIMGTQQF